VTWICVDCNTPETRDPSTGRSMSEDEVVVDAVCHHCGRPICLKNRYLIADEVFPAPLGTEPTRTYHCKECYQRHHDRVPVVDERTGAVALRR